MNIKENIPMQEGLGRGENTHPPPLIRLEPGWHPLTLEEIQRCSQRLAEEGDMGTHYWNRGVMERLKQTHPLVLAIDSQSPSLDGLSLNEKLGIWLGLPGDPREIYPGGGVLVVRGDVAPDFGLKKETLAGISSEGEDILRTRLWYEGRRRREKESDKRACEETLASIGSGIGVMFATALALTKLEPLLHLRTSRRGFLKLIGRSGEALALSSIFRPVIGSIADKAAGFSSDEQLKDLFTTAATVCRPIFFPRDWSEYRTTLLNEKTLDAYDFLHLPNVPGSIIMGLSHTSDARILNETPKNRGERIAHYTEKFLMTLDKVWIEYGIPREKARRDVLYHLAETEIVVVAVREEVDFGVSQPDVLGLIDRFVQPTARFQSPRIKTVIEQLY